MEQHSSFTYKNGIPILHMFLVKKRSEDEQWLLANEDPSYDYTNFKLYDDLES